MVFYKEKKKILPYLLIGIYSVMLTTWSTHIKRYISDIKVSSYFVSEAMAENSAQKKPIVARKISPPKSKDVPLMSDVVLSLNNFEKYILFIVFPLKNLLVHDETIISFSYGEMVSGIFIVVALCFIFSWLWKKRDLVSIAGVSFFIISLVPLCGIFFIPIFHFSSFTEYWLCVPVLGALVFLSKNIPKFKFSGLILVIILLSYAGKTIMSAYENSNPILVIQNSIDHSPNNPLVPLILAKHYYFIGEYGKSNEILLKAKKNTSLESGKLDRDIEENLRQMNGEKSEKFTL